MKKSKLFMASAAAILAVVAVFATKANKRFTNVTTAFLAGAPTWYLSIGSTVLLTTKASTPQLRMDVFYTNGSTYVPVSALSGANGDLIDKATGHPAKYK